MKRPVYLLPQLILLFMNNTATAHWRWAHGILPICQVKQRRARPVPRWVTAWCTD